MIFQRYRGHLLAVRQPDHGIQTGLFARHWGNEQTPPFTPHGDEGADGDAVHNEDNVSDIWGKAYRSMMGVPWPRQW
jgi:hypothetical protein